MSSPDATPPASSADLFNQDISIALPDGETTSFTPADIDAYTNYGIRICINYASQLGASFVLLVVLVLLTRPERRNSPIFALNMASLLVNGIRNTLQCVYFTGQFYNFYAQFSGDFSRVPRSQYGASIAGIVLTWVLLVCIEASLVLQVRAVCITLQRLTRALVLALAILVATVTVAFRFALMVTNSKAVIDLISYGDYYWLAATNNYLTMASILFFSTIFVVKLGVALQQRRRLGLRQFGPMQILFIMGCQTLVVPAVFAILQSFTDVPELGSQMLTIVALFLPLSSMWASVSVSAETNVVGIDSKQRGVSLGAHRPNQTTSTVSTVTTGVGGDVEKKPLFGVIKGKLMPSGNGAANTTTSPLSPTSRRLWGGQGIRVDTDVSVKEEDKHLQSPYRH